MDSIGKTNPDGEEGVKRPEKAVLEVESVERSVSQAAMEEINLDRARSCPGESNGCRSTGMGRQSTTPKNGFPGKKYLEKIRKVFVKFTKFVGPGFLVSVAYIDPGNYATDVQGGASFKYRLLFVVFISNIIAVFLQSLCVKLGTVTGMNLAENCKAHMPWYLNLFFYFFAEAAIIATDIAEVRTSWMS
jgi:hypothetical protein